MDKRAVLKALESGEISLEQARAALERILTAERRGAATDERPAPAASERAPAGTDIAIIGMSGRFPGAEDVAALWSCLASGRTSVSRAPTDRGWDIRDYFDPKPQTPGKTYVDKGAFLEGIDRFDPLFFGISPREAALMDPAARLFLQESWRAIEDAGYAPGRISGQSWGVFAAVKGDYEAYIQRENETYFVGTESFSAARLSYLLNLVGPAVSVDTACSSSLMAIALACDSLVLGNCDVAVAGGASVYSTPTTLISSSQSLLFSPDARCYAFDDRANGTVLGEAVAAIVLKPLRDAERDKDAILGVIKGWGTNQDGKTNGITAPSMRSQARLQSSVYRRFGIDPERITLLEAHGTGTKLGDPIEVQALTESFREFTGKTSFCALGTAKPNIGHTFFASGVAGVIKVLLCMQHGRIPPSINFASVNEHIALAESPFYVNTELASWNPGGGTPRCAAVSAFGLAGTNAHVVIEEYRRPPARGGRAAEEAMVFPLSARDPERLHEYAERLVRFLARDDSDGGLREVASTLQRGRVALDERLAVVARSRRELVQALEAFLAGDKDAAGVIRGRAARGGANAPALAGDLTGVARAWTQGAEVDWQQLWRGDPPGTAHLPTYPFARESCWFPVRGFGARPRTGDASAATAAEAVELQALEVSSAKQWLCFTEQWGAQRSERSPIDWMELRRRLGEPRVLVIGGDEAVHAAIRDPLARAFSDASLPAPTVERLTPSAPEELDGWLRRREAPHAVFLFLTDREPQDRLRAVLGCCRALSLHCYEHPIDVFVCLEDGGERLEVHGEALSGLLRSASLESANHRYHWVQHAAGGPAVRGGELAAEWLSACSRPEAARPAPLVRYREGLRLATTYREAQSIPVTPTERRFRPDGTYLVVGGLGEVGRRLCIEIGRKYRPTLVLVSRRAHDPEVERTLEELRATGARALWFSADITDRDSMSRAFADIKRAVPRIDGVLHLARAVDDGLIVSKTPEAFARTIAAKVAGTELVDLVTKDEPLDFFVMFSSMASFGLRGSSDYAYACAFQNAFARLRNRMRDRGERSGDALALCWGQWDADKYVSAERRNELKASGLDLIDAPSALRVIEACMNSADGVLGFTAVTDKDKARGMLAGRAAPRRDAPSQNAVALDPRLPGLRKALETLSYEQLLDLHSAAVAAQQTRSGR
ncbi:type I polyketide synthase [Corallococcus llansteffanensis]|nr:type I polyketide synthase [Corallococcus llansteffanensis]